MTAHSAPPSHEGQEFPPEVLTRDEAKRLIRVPSATAPTGIRNRALIVAMYRAGLRLAEALALRVSDVDTMHCAIRVLRGKGAKPRTVRTDDEAMTYLSRWIDTRRTHVRKTNGPLFCTLGGGSLQQRYVRAMLARTAERAGIDKRVYPHGLRHTYAYELTMDGVPMNVIQSQLGHSSLETTGQYLAHVAPADAAGWLRERKWDDG